MGAILELFCEYLGIVEVTTYFDTVENFSHHGRRDIRGWDGENGDDLCGGGFELEVSVWTHDI